METENGDIITQVRHIENADIDFDQLDYMNNLCRYVCSHTPDEEELQKKYQEVKNRPPQHPAAYCQEIFFTFLNECFCNVAER